MHPQKLPKLSARVLKMLTRPQSASDFMEEHCFVYAWMRLMSQQPDLLCQIMKAHCVRGVVTERDRSVAVNVVQWLGTKCGICYISEVRRTLGTGSKELLSQAFLVSWRRTNTPVRHIDLGYGTLQWIMDRHDQSDMLTARMHSPGDLKLISPLSSRDYQVAESLVVWFGTADGQEFLTAAEAEIKRLELAQTRQFHETYNLGILSPA